MSSKVFYIVNGRSKILASGTLEAPNAKESSFKLEITKEMTPSAQLLVYYFHPSGEIVYDQVKLDLWDSRHKVRR